MFCATMLQIKLGDRKGCGPDDPMSRDWIGYDPTVPVEGIFARNRGVWKLGPRADLETHAMFAYTGDHEIKFVAEIDGFERVGDRRAMIGRVLDPRDPVSQRWIGHPARGNYQNPVHYVTDDLPDVEPVGLAEARPTIRAPRPIPATPRPGAPERLPLPPAPVSGRGQPFHEHQDVKPASFQNWAASWYARLGARPESAAYLEAITLWRNAWRPKRVRILLVAESHVGEQPGDDGITVLPMRWIDRALPNRYVRLIYCLGSGESAICSTPPASNPGTPQFWNIFGQIAFGQSPLRKTATSLRDRLRWKVGVLEELERRGIWLQDASPLGIYLGHRQRVDPRHQARLLHEGYKWFVWPTVAEEEPEQVWVIGKGVYKAIAGLPGIRSDRVISQPQDRDRAQHLDGLRRLSLACSG